MPRSPQIQSRFFQLLPLALSWGLWVGPLSWLLLGLYLLLRSSVMWGGLLALYICLPLMGLFHLGILLGLWVSFTQRRCRRQRIPKFLYWGLSYYVGLPIILFVLVLKTQGWAGLHAWIELIGREGRLGWSRFTR
jgi:hypothetical protein